MEDGQSILLISSGVFFATDDEENRADGKC